VVGLRAWPSLSSTSSPFAWIAPSSAVPALGTRDQTALLVG
jgi:hypothetical protein